MKRPISMTGVLTLLILLPFLGRPATAEDSIDRCASRSEVTGKPYKVKMPNGSMRDANEFLNAELRVLRQGGGKRGAG